jgi:purine catabolism regulator
MSTSQPHAAAVGGGLRVADLVAMQHLGLKVLAGADGLNRRIEWCHVSELEDPGPWLEGGEMLIVNGFGVPASGSGQARYITRLAEHRAVALAIGVRTPPVHQDMLDAADRAGLPLLRIPKETPFVTVSHLVANANQHGAQRRLVRHLQILDTLRLRNGIRASTQERFAQLEDVSGYRLALISAVGHPVFAEWPWVPAQLDVTTLVTHGEDRVVIDGGYALPIMVGHRIAAFLIALEQPEKESAGLAALQHIATVAALEVLEEYRLREARRRSGAEVLAELLAGHLTAEEATMRLEREGLPRDEPLVLAAFGATNGEIDDDDLYHRLSDRGVGHLMLRQDELYVLLPDQTDPLECLVDELDVTAGVSSVIANRSSLAVARREALWSLASAGVVAGRRVVRFAAEDTFAHWFPPDLDALRLMVSSTLGVIIEYDESHNTELLKSLVAFFRNERKLRQTAEELFVHEHTLSYRLKRIEAITNRNLNDLQDTSELWLALKALPIVRAPHNGRR